jgi:hypothetical protein
MFLRASTLAPEKAVSRPALTLRPFSPGLLGADMKKLTYGEQLLHPNWQRVRLERLDAADWKCQVCGDKDTTLHVHHKQYIKGRMAWDYPAENFEVLCKNCHKDEHAAREELSALLMHFWASQLSEAIPVLMGYFHYVLPEGLKQRILEADRRTSAIGLVASTLNNDSSFKGADVVLLALALQDEQFLDEMRCALSAFRERFHAPEEARRKAAQAGHAGLEGEERPA